MTQTATTKPKKRHRSLVLDQSSTCVGFAIVEADAETPVSFGVSGKLIQHGRITTPKNASLIPRLEIIRADITRLIESFKPTEMVLEDTTKLKQRTGKTNHALAAVYYCCQEMARTHGLKVYSQHPAHIKKFITGKGNADKAEVLAAVLNVWGLSPHKVKDDNHADVLAAAYLWLYQGEDFRHE